MQMAVNFKSPLFGFFLSITILSNAQVKTLNGTELSSNDIDNFIGHQMDSLGIPGLSIAIIQDEKVVYYKAGGIKNEKELLASAYLNSLKLAEEKQLSSIAFPNISTGVYGFPKQQAAEIAISTVNQFMKNAMNVKEVIFVCYDEENFKLYQLLLG